MKKLYVAVLISLTVLVAAYSEDQIIDLDGDTIILHDNFTWSYAEIDKEENTEELILNYDPYTTETLISKNGKYKIHINTEFWERTTGLNDSAEFQFINEEETGFGVVIYDGLSIPLDNMRQVLLENAYRVDPNARITKVENCIVNNTPGQLVTYSVSNIGLDFLFYSCIVSTENGTIQYTFFTLVTEFSVLKPLFLEAISGLELK